jgi:hypothetical protein
MQPRDTRILSTKHRYRNRFAGSTAEIQLQSNSGSKGAIFWPKEVMEASFTGFLMRGVSRAHLGPHTDVSGLP